MRLFGVIKKGWLRLRFIRRKRENMASAPPQTNGSQTLPVWNIYSSAHECPIRVFMNALIAEDSTLLVISGHPPEDEIERAWLSVYSIYCSLVGGVEISRLIKRNSAISTLASKIERVSKLLEVASLIADMQVSDALKDDGIVIDCSATDAEYFIQINRAKSRLKSDVMRLEMLVAERPKAKPGKHMQTEESFVNTLMEVSKHEGYPVKDNISVYEYGMYVRRLRSHIEAMNKITKNKINGSSR